MKVNHRGGDVVVTQHLLEVENITTVGHPSAREAMAKHMDVDMGKTGSLGCIPYYDLNSFVTETLPRHSLR